MSVVGEAAISNLLEKIFDKLSSSFKQEQFQRWKRILLKIHAVLDDAEEKQKTSWGMKIWLDELKDLVYDIEDILGDFSNEVLRHELNPEPNKNKIRKIINACVGLNRSFARSMRPKIEDIDTRLQSIVKEKDFLVLRENIGGRTRTTRSRVPTTSLVNEGHTYGRDEDKKAIVDLLLGGESNNTGLDLCFSVIPILGMRGVVKTTLAQLVYNDNNVSHSFDLKAWVCVSEDFDIVRVTKEILQDITYETCKDSDLNLLQRKLKEQLLGKKFLLILDDVWNENNDNWSILRKQNCLLPQLRYLRVLSLGGYAIVEVPDSVGDLKHLRYLNLSNAEIRSLPESICSLYNLQTLILKDCFRLIKLPEKIGNLVNLRHLDITNVNLIREMPVGIKELKSLKTLSNFVVG